MKYLIFSLSLLALISCKNAENQKPTEGSDTQVQIVGAMKNVMWQGQLQGQITLDTIADKKGLYGLGPQSYLSGELLINNGKSYLSKVTSDSTMAVVQNYEVEAPFFVYANVTNWQEFGLPGQLKTIKDLEAHIDSLTKDWPRPFAFKLAGKAKSAAIHIQNLPPGTKVSSPAEAHQGQTNYTLENTEVAIIGFFSTEHKGIFTHHDSFLHMHLITKDESQMGHLDSLNIQQMSLFLPQIGGR